MGRGWSRANEHQGAGVGAEREEMPIMGGGFVDPALRPIGSNPHPHVPPNPLPQTPPLRVLSNRSRLFLLSSLAKSYTDPFSARFFRTCKNNDRLIPTEFPDFYPFYLHFIIYGQSLNVICVIEPGSFSDCFVCVRRVQWEQRLWHTNRTLLPLSPADYLG